MRVLNALEGKELPVYGKGENIRDWLYVEDHARALCHVLINGQVGETYNIGGRNEKTNIEVVHSLCRLLDQIAPDSKGPYKRLIQFVTDRSGHDRRYAIDDTKIASKLGWRHEENFESGLEKTVRWYVSNLQWVERIRSGAYREWMQTNYSARENIE